MDSAFGWLGQIINFFLSLLPSIFICEPTEEGVKFVYGSRIKLITHNNGLYMPSGFWFERTGIHVYWPIVTTQYLVPIKRQTINLVPQYLCTADNITVGVSSIVVYEVEDTIKLLTHCHDHDETIEDLALTVVKQVITENNFEFISSTADIDGELTEKLITELKPFGVKVIKCTLSDFTRCKVHAMLGMNPYVQNSE